MFARMHNKSSSQVDEDDGVPYWDAWMDWRMPMTMSGRKVLRTIIMKNLIHHTLRPLKGEKL